MLLLKDMTLRELRDALVSRGLHISYDKMMICIDKGYFPFVKPIPMKQNEFLILQKDFEEWANEHSIWTEDEAVKQ